MCSDEVHFAFYYPFSYSDCQRLLGNIDVAMAAVATQQSQATSQTRNARDQSSGGVAAPLYYHRELLTHSLQGRRVELLTITDANGKASNREQRPAGLFPDSGCLRPHVFRDKPAVYVGARVHPGETAASYMLHGLLAFLLQPRNAYAAELRRRFVFKLVPMINPDGVFWGHFRTDTTGVNLNRQYAMPLPQQLPSIYAVKEMLKQLASTYTPAPMESLRAFRDRFVHGQKARGGRTAPSKGGSDRGKDKKRGKNAQASRSGFARGTFSSRAASTARVPGAPSSGLWMCLDLHGYTARRGCYILANSTTPAIEARALAFANTVQLYAPQFSASACSFGRGKFSAGGSTSTGSAGGAAAAASSDKPPSKRAAYATPYGSDVMDKSTAAALQRSMRAGATASSSGGGASYGSGAHGSHPGYDKGTASNNELWAANIAGLVDPYELLCEGVPAGLTFGSSTARLADSDSSRLNREWAAHKARATARAEGNKDGAGRVTLWKELKVPHSYTVEGSCNLLNHTRVFSRLYAGPSLHRDMLATVGPSCTPSSTSGAAVFSVSRPPSGLSAAGSRALGGASRSAASTPPKPPEGACTVVHCENAKVPLLSQVHTQQGCAPDSKWCFPAGVQPPLTPKLAPSALAADASVAPVAAAPEIAQPYMCAVDALQPPPKCASFCPPFGFHSTPPSHDASGRKVALYEELFHAARQQSTASIFATAEYTCGWGTCAHDPPAAFAAVGRALAFAMLELSGGHTHVTSRLPHSVWGSLEALHRWSRRRVALAAGLPLPSDSALAEVIGPSLPSRAPVAASPEGRAAQTPNAVQSQSVHIQDGASTDTGGSDSDSDASLSGLAAVQESERRAFALVRDARSPSPASSDTDGGDAPVWGSVVSAVPAARATRQARHPSPPAGVPAPLKQHSFTERAASVHSPAGTLKRRAHLGQMRPPALLESDPSTYFAVSGASRQAGGLSTAQRRSAASAGERSRRGGTAVQPSAFAHKAAGSSPPITGTQEAFLAPPNSLQLSGVSVHEPSGNGSSSRAKGTSSGRTRLVQRTAAASHSRRIPSILPTRAKASGSAAPAQAAASAAAAAAAGTPGQGDSAPERESMRRKVRRNKSLRGWSASSSASGAGKHSPRLNLLN